MAGITDALTHRRRAWLARTGWFAEGDGAFGDASRTIAGVSHCDRDLFAGDAPALYRFWNGRAGTA